MADILAFQVFDHRGVLAGELEPEVESITWKLNDVGKLQYSVAKSEPKATPDFLRFGNLVRVQFGNGLPDWAGVVEPPRTWGADRIQCSAYSAEYLLGFRQTGRGRYFTQASVGYIFSSVVAEAASAADMLIDLGEVWLGGGSHSPDYHFQDLLTIARESIGKRLTPADFVLQPVVTDGVLRFRASLLERRGQEMPGLALVEQLNLGHIRLVEQGPIVNSWTLVGEGTTWGPERLIVAREDAASIAEYGLREASEVLASVSEPATLEAAAAERIGRTARPRVMLELEALDAPPARFADYDVGDVLTLRLDSYGFEGYEGPVRVLAREYRPKAGVCGLVVQEWRE
jgi:hypothetical protein